MIKENMLTTIEKCLGEIVFFVRFYFIDTVNIQVSTELLTVLPIKWKQ